MKPFILYALIFLFLVSCKVKSDVAASDSEPTNTKVNHTADSKDKEVPYKVLRKAPTLKYQVRKSGDGNKVLFYIGNRSLPNETQISPSNGVPYKEGKKVGYYQLNFPAKFTIYCPSNNMTNPFDSMPQMINDFEIEFYHRGNWEVKFIQ